LVCRPYGHTRSRGDRCAVGAKYGFSFLSLIHVNPIKLLVLVAVINGVAAAPFLVVVMPVSGSRRLMGDSVNGKAATTIGWLTAALMGVAAVIMFATGGVSL
jgi:Mn2+/Fe2+ NRAMP family transporter